MKYIPYGRQSIDERDIKEVVSVLRSDFVTQGPKVKEFEDTLASFCGAKYVVALSSGTAALHLACLAAGIENGDEVITSPLTFAASANCVLYCQGVPKFTDIDPLTLNIDPDLLENAITKKTKAIIPVDFAGLPCDYQRISEIASKKNLTVIQDAAHSLGAEYKIGKQWFKVGNGQHSDMTIFSFHPVKLITTGEGGAVATNNKKLYERLLALRAHGIYKDKKTAAKGLWYYEMRDLGFNYRLTDVQSALGISQLKKAELFVKERRELAQTYSQYLSAVENIVLPPEPSGKKSAWHIYPVRIKKSVNPLGKRKAVFDSLRKEGIGVQVHYIPVYFHPFYQKMGYKMGLCPRAEDYYKRAFSLPLYPGLAPSEVKSIVRKLIAILKYA
ncbi:MAG: UDP-4-amino-4,6-dideoxy-N-acetyl-beta-L-altrosamine transaminase [Candidatus Omnitrophica bacterium]|nr:UDP-4-amino-4,6-dideoxy-N-acetyl-beta-L-altrosamine transaminase [Candidatus Omnitrophota bacterium]